MNIVVIVWALLLLVSCMTLLFHPLLRYLALSEVPAAVLVCLCGRRYRRALAGILARRRDAVRVPPRPEKTKLPVAAPRALSAPSRRMPAAVASDWAALADACARCGKNWRSVR